MLGDKRFGNAAGESVSLQGLFLGGSSLAADRKRYQCLVRDGRVLKKTVAGRRLSQSQTSQLLSSLDELALNRRVEPEPALRQRVPQPLDRREWLLLKLLVDCASTDLNGRLRLPNRRGQTGGDDELPLAIGAGPLAVETWMRDSPRDDAVA